MFATRSLTACAVINACDYRAPGLGRYVRVAPGRGRVRERAISGGCHTTFHQR